MSVDAVVPIGWDVLKSYVVVPIKRRFGYVISSKSFADSLREEVGNLENEAQKVNVLAEQARNNLRNFYDGFTEWQQRTVKALKEARDLLGDFENASKTCCYGTLPDPKFRYQFSRKAEGKIKVIKQLAQNCSGFKELNDISFSDPAPGNVTAPNQARREGKEIVQSTTAMASVFSASMSIKHGDDGIFESRAQIILDIKDALADNSNSVVGVHGMGGLGKSTLLEEVKKTISKEKSFDWVAKADVSQNPDIKRIQGEIADALGLSEIKDKESVRGRAELLQRRLEEEERNKKKVLIILDNLWKGLDLKLVGIPCGPDNKVIGCKLLLTSRDRNVLQKKMGSDRDFCLDRLEEKEAKRLFERLVGDKVHDNKVNPLADEALHKCAGLPFLIVQMATVLKYTDLSEWKKVLKQIKLSKNEEINEVINNTLQLSYNNLTVAQKSLLTLCVAYGTSKPSLENLVRYGVGWGLFQEDDKIEEARERLRSGIRALQASSLLLEDRDDYGFKIHDLVHEFVASVALSDRPLLVLKDKDKPITGLLKHKLESCSAVCFSYVDMKELPQVLDCPELQIFLLFTNNVSLKVPDSLFHSMRKLMVLNLTGIRLTCSPSSPFQFLENLTTLCLDRCSLDDVAILGELTRLQILSFVNSKIQRLPKEIGQLVELRLLDLNYCFNLQKIEPGVLGSLTKLEELYMEKSFDQWNDVDQTPPTNASLIELNSMKNLCTLHVSIPNPSVLPKDLNFKQLTKYKIQIGNPQRWPCRGSSTLAVQLDPLSDVLQKGCIQSILGKTDDLFLRGLDGSERSICQLSQNGFPELKHLEVENSPSVHYILQSPSHVETLESLLLENLINLEKICHGHITSKSFSTLKVVRVESCDNMAVLFPLSVVRGLPMLEEIEVVGCKLMRGIVEADDYGKVELCNLCVLELRDLPNIKNFFNAGSASSCSTSDDQVNTQIAFFNGQRVSIPSLESLTIEGLPNLKEIWSDESPLEMSNLQSLKVVRCESLLKVISSKLLVKLHKLHTLTIKDCISVQEIFDLDGPSGSGNLETLNELTTISLGRLPSLSCIWNKNPCGIVTFHDLKKLEVDRCDNLGFIFFPSMVKTLTQLRDLTVRDCNNMEVIITEEEGFGMEILETLAFPMLTNLCLARLESLMCFFPGKCSREARSQGRVQSRSIVLLDREVAFPNLETLDIIRLDNIEMIWDNQITADSFPKLKLLCVYECNKLVIVVRSSVLGRLSSLTSLNTEACDSLEVVFELQPLSPLDGHPIGLPLKGLTLSGLPKLKCVWDKELHHQVKFQCLRSISISRCESLTSLFPASVAGDLMQLEELKINECGIVELIEKEEGLVPKFVFPNLTSLELTNLTELKCIYTGTHASHWPALKTLVVSGYNKVEILACQPDNAMPRLKQSLFSIEKEPIPQVAFSKLETLEIIRLDNLRFMFSSSMVKSLPQLKKLRVRYCKKMEAIITEEGGLGMETTGTLAFPMLTDLRLERLASLTCFFCVKSYREAQSQDHIESHSTTLFNREVVFPGLETLQITSLDNIVMIWDDQVAADSFPKLKSLCVDECNRLVNVVTSSILGRILSLESLKAQSCGLLKVVFKFQPQDSLDGYPISRSPLKELTLIDLPKLKCVWDKELHRQVKFQCLRSVSVEKCESLTSLFPGSIARDLMQFEELKIQIRGIVEIIEKDEPEELSINVEAIEGASHELTIIFAFTSYFQHLKTLDVSYYDGLSNMFTPTIATNLVALTKLRIRKCRMFTEVLSDEGGREGHVVAFNQLKYMELKGLTRLRCFSSGGYALMFPLLEDVIVTECLNMNFFSKGPIEAPKLKRVQVSRDARAAWFWKEDLNITIQNMFEEMGMFAGVKKMLLSELPDLIGKWHSELNPRMSSWQLESLTVDKCPSFIKAIPSKLMLVLDNMDKLQVRDCESLEEIFNLEGLEAVESTRLLPRLFELNLVNLPKLRRLWNKDLQGSMCFNSLWYLTLYNCSTLGHAFTPSMARCLARLWRIEIKECGQMDGVIADEEGQGSAMEKITFPKLNNLKLECLPSLTSFLLGKNHTLECPKLEVLTIAHCPKMRSLTWQSSMEIDHGTPSLFTSQVQFPQLKSMVLSHMDKLSKIWIDNPLETLTFEHLRKLEVQNCKSLENLFPLRVATNLTQLKELRVESCGIKEIVASGDDTPHSNIAQVLFPKLTSLVLHDMPRLKSFFPNLPTLNWPFLEELRVTHCDKVNMLSFAASMNEWTQRDDQRDLSDQEAHSSIERDFPNLERLLLVDKDVQMIQDGKLLDDIFGKPKALTLACFHDEKAIFPPRFLLEKFQNLQSLEVFCSSFEDIFPDEGLVDEGKHSALENLKELKLSKLHNLQRVWREDHLMAKILRSIEKFEVWDCPHLTTIFPTMISFQNLTELVVKNSSGLVYLVTASAVTNLVHLTDMTIIGCERMKEVVVNDGNGEGNVIYLGKLKWLTLQNLPSLECFSSVPSCILTLPSLWRIKVEECPQMKIFSKGTLSTPKLRYMSLFRYDWNREGGDLNTTIQKLSA